MIDGLFIYEDKTPLVFFPTNGTDVSDVTRKISECNVRRQEFDWHAPLEISSTQALMVRQYGRLLLMIPFGTDSSPLLVEELLDRIIVVVETCLKAPLTPNLVIDNKAQLVLILSEMIDTGVPRLTEPNIIEHMLYKDSILSQLLAQATSAPAITAQTALSRSTSQGTQTTPDSLVPWDKPWRRPRVKYGKEELFVDIIEHVTGVTKAKGFARPSGLEIHGEILLTSRLSDDPRVLIDMKLPVSLSQIQVHPAVDKSQLKDSSREYSSYKLALSPPDAKSRLCSYSLVSGDTGPLSVKLNRAEEFFEVSLGTSIDIKVEHIKDLIVSIVFPPSVKSVKEMTSTGGDLNVSNPQRCIYRLGRTVPMGWKAQIRAQGLTGNAEYVSPLYVEVQYNLQGRVSSTASVNSISVSPISRSSNPPFKGVRYQTFVDSLIIA